MASNESTLSIINIAITVLLSLLTSLIAAKHVAKPEKQRTSRLIFDNCYSKIYSLVEYKLYSKDVTLVEVREIGNEIVSICDSVIYYYYPSVKHYAERMRDSDNSNYMENWQYFSKRFSMRYDTVCRDIGLPLRNNAYRLNHNQYQTDLEFWIYLIKNEWLEALFLLFIITVVIYLNL